MSAQILIADDDGAARDAMAAALAARGHAVTTAGDGAAALARLRGGGFAVAVLAGALPALDAAAAARRARTAAAADTRFLAVTADPAGLEARAGGAGLFDAVVQKPINAAAFVEAVEDCLGARRRAAAERAVLDAWAACGFARRPRARFAAEPGRDWLRRLGAALDLSRPGNPDVVVLTEAERVGELAELRVAGNLFALPMVDAAGRWGRLADAAFDVDDPRGWEELAAVARGFAARRAQLSARFLSAGDLPDKLLAYVFVSGRDLVPLDLDADEWTPTYPGFFPVRRVRDAAEKLVHGGMLTRESLDEGLFTPPRFALTARAVACLTGALAPEAPRRRARG